MESNTNVFCFPLRISLPKELLQTLSKSCKQLALRIAPEKLVFILNEKDSGGHLSAWCEFTKEPYFVEYCMEGVTPQDNEIYLDISSGLI